MAGDFNFLREYSALAWLMDAFPFAFAHGPFRTFVTLCGVVGVGVYLKVLFMYFSRSNFTYRSRQFTHLLRTAGMRKALSFGKQYYDSSRSGQLQTVVDTYSQQISDQLFSAVQTAAATLPAVMYFGLMLMISWQITAVAVVLLPVFYFMLKPLTRQFRQLADQQAITGLRVGRSIQRALRGISIVKANGTEEQEAAEFDKLSAESSRLSYELARRSFFVDLLIQAIIITGVGLTAFGLLIAFKDDFANRISGYVVYLYFLRLTVDCVRNANRVIMVWHMSLSLSDTLLSEIDEAAPFHLVDGTEIFTGIEDRIVVEGLNFHYYADEVVLKDVSMTIEKGQVVALVGPSGSGKSTFVQLLMRLYECPEGTIFVDGKDLRSYQIQSLRKRIAFVNQRSNLLDDTLRNNITYGSDRPFTDEELWDVLRAARLEEVVQGLPFGLDTQLGDDGIRLSGGEAQRVSIARALLKDAEFLVLDEATSALDAITERLIQEAIDELVVGRTVVVIAHRFSTLANADKVVAFKNGRILEQGPLEELLSSGGLFAELWRQQELKQSEPGPHPSVLPG